MYGSGHHHHAADTADADAPRSSASLAVATSAAAQIRTGVITTSTLAPSHFQHQHHQHQQQHQQQIDRYSERGEEVLRRGVGAAREEALDAHLRNQHERGSSASWGQRRLQQSPRYALDLAGPYDERVGRQYTERTSYAPRSLSASPGYERHDHHYNAAGGSPQLERHSVHSYDTERQHEPPYAAMSMRRSFTGKRKADAQNDAGVPPIGYTSADVAGATIANNVHLTPPHIGTAFASRSHVSSPSLSQHQHYVADYSVSADHPYHLPTRHHPHHHHIGQPLQRGSQAPPRPPPAFSATRSPLVYQQHHDGFRRPDPAAASLQPAWHQHREDNGLLDHEDEASDASDSESKRRLSPLAARVATTLSSSSSSSTPPVQSMAQVSVSDYASAAPARTQRPMPPPQSPRLMLPPPGRVITNASRNVTFAMLQPHFERPLQEAALRFGVCTTLLKKICRKNGIKNWPFRRICGLHKSIASMAKQVHYFDGAQKQSYAEQLYKLELELEAYKHTGNAPTPAFIAAIEVETGGSSRHGGGDDSSSMSATRSRRETSLPLSATLFDPQADAETKTQDVEIAPDSFARADDPDAGASALSPRTTQLPPQSLSAVSTRVSVASYRYTTPSPNQAEDEHHERTAYVALQQQHAYADAHRVMMSTVDLGDDNIDRERRDWHPQQLVGHRQQVMHRSDGSAAGRSAQRLRVTGQQHHHPLLQRTLPSLSYMLHRQSQPMHERDVPRAEGTTATAATHSQFADESVRVSPNQQQEHHF